MKILIRLICSKLLFCSSLFVLLFCSCSKKDARENIDAAKAPVINFISPTHGPGNTVVKITGLNFSNVLSNNIVKFNGTIATVISASDTQLVANVPLDAETGNVSLTVNGFDITGPIFTYEYVAIVSTIIGNNNSAHFSFPVGVAVDKQNNIYVTEALAARISKISAAGDVSVLAGNGSPGFVNGVGSEARFNFPWAIEVDSLGTAYVADMYNHSIRKVTSAGIVTTIAGTGVPGYLDGPTGTARFNYPDGITLDSQKNVYVSDKNNAAVRIITPSGIVSSLYPDRYTAPFYEPHGLLINTQGEIYVADPTSEYDRIMRTNIHDIWAWKQFGAGTPGYKDGPVDFARFYGPNDVVEDAKGNIYIADNGNLRIRKLTPDGMVSTVAGSGNSGSIDGLGTTAEFKSLSGIAIDKKGNLYVADSRNGTIRKISFQ